MENNNNNQTELKLLTKQETTFWTGTVLCVIALILFFIGTGVENRNGLWIAAAVSGGIAAILYAFSIHSVNGWTRMFSVFFMEVLVVIGTIMGVHASM